MTNLHSIIYAYEKLENIMFYRFTSFMNYVRTQLQYFMIPSYILSYRKFILAMNINDDYKQLVPFDMSFVNANFAFKNVYFVGRDCISTHVVLKVESNL